MDKILLVEDDSSIALGIKLFLGKNGFQVEHVDCIKSAKSIFLNEKNFSLALLDLNLPDGSGYEICEFIKEKKDLPVIFLTVCDESTQIVKGLDMGADDYIVKPFEPNVLLSRIKMVLRRNSKISIETLDILSCGNIKLDKTKQAVYLLDKKIELTVNEYNLLSILLENKNRVLTRVVLLEKLWDNQGNFVNDNTLTVSMKRLREKLNQPSVIKTVRGVGYSMEDEDE